MPALLKQLDCAWMWMPHEFATLRFAPPEHAKSTPVSAYVNVCVDVCDVPTVVIGLTTPLTTREPV
jgi:hypothetical protein